MGDHEELLEEAQAQTGLRDFGDESFLEGLEILVRFVMTHRDPTEVMVSVAGVYADIIARYRWDGEETYGMIERSSPKDKVTR